MDIELSQLVLRYEQLRRRNAGRERRLVASLAESGQQVPVVIVGNQPDQQDRPYVLLDGYKRVRALKKLRHDLVRATLWDLAEAEAVLLERLMRSAEPDGALEQGWLLEELHERFSLSHEELARRFDKSQSWVSRRLALVRAVPSEVQQQVQRGRLPAHAAMKYLVPMARAKRADCVRLIQALKNLHPSTRDMEALYTTWIAGDEETREMVVTQPAVVLKARQQAKTDQSSEKTPVVQLVRDFGVIIGTSRRTRTKLLQGLVKQLLPAETRQVRRMVQQARWECNALFRSAAPLLESEHQVSATQRSTPPFEKPRPSQELNHD